VYIVRFDPIAICANRFTGSSRLAAMLRGPSPRRGGRPSEGAMFGRVIVVVILAVATALLGSFSLLERLSAPAPVVAAPAPAAQDPTGFVADAPAPESGYRGALLEADKRGQYAAGALINGAPVRMLIDTGATEVCISASTARRLGLSPSVGRKRLIQTANRQSTASPTILRSLSLDGLYMTDVEYRFTSALPPMASPVTPPGMALSCGSRTGPPPER
jgi:clan AA aspartic protease (TIGR02281 family)